MSFVLAVEPDGTQAEVLRRLLGGQGSTELVLVTSTYAAIVAINRRVPDLVLLGASLGLKAQDVVNHLRSVSGIPNAQTLRIPPLRTTDPEAFAAEVALCLARAEEQRRQPVQAAASGIDPGVARSQQEAGARSKQEAGAGSTKVADAGSTPEASAGSTPEAAAGSMQEEDAGSTKEDDVLIDLEPHASDAAPIDAELHYAHVALVQADAEDRLKSELERVRREAAEQRTAELAKLQAEADAQRRAEVAQARAAATSEARDALSAEFADIRSEAEQSLAAELARVRAEAAQRLAEQLAEADALRAAEVEQARLAAEQMASQALEGEVARIKVYTEERLAAELRRVHDEAEQARRSHEQTLQEQDVESVRDAAAHEARAAAAEAAARALAAEAARVRQESDERLEAELARARAEADEARRAQQQAQVDLEAIREAAARDARAAAEQAAARALEAEAERVRRDADARVQEELARVHAEAEQTRQAQEEAQVAAAAARDAAVREARAAAEAAAAREHERELARVREEAESRLRVELARAHEEAERGRMAGASEIVRVRQDAEREALARAQATLEAEIARAQKDADARLAFEVADARAVAERRRFAELAEVRAQLAQVHEAAREHARSAAAGAVSAEVARAEITIPMAAARVAAHAGSHAASATAGAARIALRLLGSGWRASLPVIRDVWERRPAYTLPAAAIVLLVAGGVAFVGVSSLTSSARSASGAVGALFSRAGQAVRGSLASNDAPKTTEPPAQAVVDAPPEPTKPAGPASPGWLAVFSRVPLDLFVSGRRIGAANDGQILLPSGRYRVELVSTRLNYRGEVTLDVRPTAVTAHTVTLPNGSLRVTTETGAEIWIEGERAGVAPLGVVGVPIGTREIVVRHPDLGERREVVEVRFGEVTEISIARREARDPREAYPLPSLGQPGAPIR